MQINVPLSGKHWAYVDRYNTYLDYEYGQQRGQIHKLALKKQNKKAGIEKTKQKTKLTKQTHKTK